MQRLDPVKRSRILAVAAAGFATRRYDEVTLDSIAADARIGKGTIYVYFASKDELCRTLVREGVAALIGDLEARNATATGSGLERLANIVDEMLAFSKRAPHVSEMLRRGILPSFSKEQGQHHRRLQALIVAALKAGIARHEIADAHPALTAQCVLGYVRNALLFGTRGPSPRVLRDHLLGILRRGLAVPRSATRTKAKGRSA